jgi:hypothetical protein
MNRQSLERQLAASQARLEVRNKALKAAGVEDANRGSDPVWRSLDASRRILVTRLRSVGQIEKRDADAAARRESGDAESEE